MMPRMEKAKQELARRESESEKLRRKFKELDDAIRARHVIVVRYRTAELARRHLFEEKEKIELEENSADVSDHFLLWGRFVFVGRPRLMDRIRPTLGMKPLLESDGLDE
jgi:hypothetical protein